MLYSQAVRKNITVTSPTIYLSVPQPKKTNCTQKTRMETKKMSLLDKIKQTGSQKQNPMKSKELEPQRKPNAQDYQDGWTTVTNKKKKRYAYR